MRSTALVGVLAVLFGIVSCGGDDESSFPPGGKAGSGGTGNDGGLTGGTAGAAGAAGRGGSGTGGSGGSATGGTGGSPAGGSGGTSTAGGGPNTGGTSGTGTSGSSGNGGGSGDASAGSSGSSGTGSGGAAGAAGAAGTGGGTGSGGGDGSAGVSGSGGTSGSSSGGTSGSSSGGTSGSSSGGTSGSSSGGASGSSSGGASGSSSGGTSGSSSGGAAGSAGDAGPACGIAADCDNGIYCDGVETCDNGACAAGTPVACADDGFACTAEVCDETNKRCSSVPQDSRCDDTVFCNGSEECTPGASGAGADGCAAGTPPTCNDGMSCTNDSCDEANRRCEFTPVHARCQDGLHCTGAELCDPENGAAGTGCRAGEAPDCDDAIACTTDSCNENQDRCDHVANALFCSNGQPCDGAEVCDPTPGTGGCKPGTPVSCVPDGIACSTEACNPLSGQCQTTYNSGLCPAGQTCTTGGCMDGATCTTGAQCQDGDACNGIEVCDTSITPGICRPGTPVSCDDGIDCTLNLCNPATGACSHPPDSSVCGDANPCNGVETCDATPGTGGCKAGTPLQCNDNIACTTDLCGATGCVHLADDDACSDGLVCNGVETCDPTPGSGGCKAGTAPNCTDDGIACTREVCAEPLGCTSVPDNTRCPCGQTCSVAQGACGNFCNVSSCGGKLYQCGDCLDNDGDCAIDSADSLCTGVCDNTENHLYPNLPGAPGGPCKLDCFFDNGNGSGNDDCYWDHKCDPLEVAPNYPPEGPSCAYTPGTSVRQGMSCTQAMTQQSATCNSYCGPLVPNGCDCFGCCAIPGAPTTVWLGSEDGSDNGTCTPGVLNDPTKCKPCTQVPACLNTCAHCELCLGKPTLPADCSQQLCPPGVQLCGIPGQAPCPAGSYCVTGCCQPGPGE